MDGNMYGSGKGNDLGRDGSKILIRTRGNGRNVFEGKD